MSATIHNALQLAVAPRVSAESARAHVVASALEVIAAKFASGVSKDLNSEFAKLSEYADQIQAALKAK